MTDPSPVRRVTIPGPFYPDWTAAAGPGASPLGGDGTGLRLTADPAGPLRLDSSDGSLGRLTLPRGMAVDRDLRVYLLDPERGLALRHDPGAAGYDPWKPFRPLPAVGNDARSGGRADNPRRFGRATAVAVDHDTLYVADGGLRRVLAFALDTWALREVWA